MGRLHPEQTGMRPVPGTAVFMVASPLAPRVAPWPVGLGGAEEPKGRATELLTGGGTAAGAGVQVLATGGVGAIGGLAGLGLKLFTAGSVESVNMKSALIHDISRFP